MNINLAWKFFGKKAGNIFACISRYMLGLELLFDDFADFTPFQSLINY